jgi:hypothetical protein
MPNRSLEDQWLKSSSATPNMNHVAAWQLQATDAAAPHALRSPSAVEEPSIFTFQQQQQHLEMLPRPLMEDGASSTAEASLLNGHSKTNTLYARKQGNHRAFLESGTASSVAADHVGSMLPQIVDASTEEGGQGATRSSTCLSSGAADSAGHDDADWAVLQQAMQAFQVDSHIPVKGILSDQEREAEGISHAQASLSLQQQQVSGFDGRLDANDPRSMLPESLGLDLDGGHSSIMPHPQMEYLQQQQQELSGAQASLMQHQHLQSTIQQKQALSQLSRPGLDGNGANYVQQLQTSPMGPLYTQQHWGAGPQLPAHRETAGSRLSGDMLLAGALQGMKHRAPNGRSHGTR